MAAGVGWPSGPKAAATAGPVTCSSRSVWRSEMRETPAMSRRGVAWVSTGAPALMRKVSSSAPRRSPSCRDSGASQLAGISSHPISSSSSRSMGNRGGRRGLDVGLGDGHRELADAQDVRGPLGDADAAAGVEHVEQVRALEALLERGNDQPGLDQLLGHAEVLVEEVAMKRR